MIDDHDALIVEVMDHAPADLTPAERLILTTIAVRSCEQSSLPPRECYVGIAELMTCTGLKKRGVQAALRRLAARGIEIRVPLSVGKDGRPVYAFRGQVPRFRLPRLATPQQAATLDKTA